MQRLGYTLLTVLEQTTHGVISTLRLRHQQDSGHEPTVDLLCGATGIEQEIVAQATEVQISASAAVPVATVSHPIAMKSCLKTKTGIMTVATSKHCSRLHRLLKLKPLETR